MNPLMLPCLLLAQNARAEQFVKGFQAGNLHFPMYVVLPLAICGLALAGGLYVMQRFKESRERGRYYSDRRLFYDLCRLHRLDLHSSRFLLQLAREGKYATLAEVFVRPELFQAEAAGLLSRKRAALVERLREKLFAQPRSSAAL